MIELLLRTLCDVLPSNPTDGAYLFAQTPANQRSVFETGVDLMNQGKTKKLFISASAPISGYPGFKHWQQDLQALGLSEADVIAIPPTDDTILHTRIEAEGLVRYAKAKHLSKLTVISAPFHQLRAFMTTVTVALEEMPELQIYSRVGASLPWNETVTHSQGNLEMKRRNLVQAELERIERYQQKGDLGKPGRILDYLNRRDHT